MRSKLLVLILTAATVGVCAGIGIYVFWYARGSSYLTNDPQACANCHVMRDHFDAWVKSSHHLVAVCNDCHTPHNPVGKWTVKAINGWNHSVAFTTQRFHEPIQITAMNLAVTENACRRCHAEIVEQIDSHPGVVKGQSDKLSCIKCHKSVGHME
ncbi:MAG: cytochrome c nitrite reductase small subunit [Candidatus Hydrogenedentota bacterium]|uniref:Cytochrome c nitrite reductase subunit NrfH n=1 Tax=Sumerlaea chitinivorans TaxID=2250252 RepID=A0A2Z4Y1U9_SUMC1|nr:Cytochrome c nitrite reductase subunit NrfH [Candidatus Sumerlaea chitinivorans]MCX7962952.1 cytochrome c nitrite reductase small subunit [Candidatus Sumerlaea chitinivorans]RMH23795.1 MAG: cytochrome c nitrite reductase small subunit [Candidatus Hydrogenedentota bacterium]GIX44844.1 MAG: cytochrome c nitrite reductase small subunit [Candidatus Sumerlaea sp.]